MMLKTKLLWATVLTVLTILGISEWLNLRHTAAFVREHEVTMMDGTSQGSMISALDHAKHGLFRDLVVLHVAHALLTVMALVCVLHILWWRLFLRPLHQILQHVRTMGQGVWTNPIRVERSDEIGDLIRAFNALGDQLGASVEQVALTSRLSALALLGGRVVRKTGLVRAHVQSIESVLAAAEQDGTVVPAPVLCNLMQVGTELEQMIGEFEHVFTTEFDSHSASALISAPFAASKSDAIGPSPYGRQRSGRKKAETLLRTKTTP